MLLWALAMFPLLKWFATGLESHFDFLSGTMLVVIAALWFRSGFKNLQFPKAGFYMNRLALGLGAIAFLAFLFLKHQSNVRIISFAVGACVLYALLSLVMHPSRWRAGILPFALLLMTLPFGRHFDMLLGYPLRMLAVDISFSALSHVYPELTSNASILMIENRASHVDMDCSGLRGLWVGLIFMLSISWIERSKWNMRWLGAMLAAASMILVGNVCRIMLLAFVQLNSDLEFLDPVVHHSTSLFFLLFGCLIGFMILQGNAQEQTKAPVAAQRVTSSMVVPVVVLCFMMLMVAVPYYKAMPVEPHSHSDVKTAIADLGWKQTALTPAERINFENEGVDAVKFEKDDIQMVVVLGGDWRSQHIPEMCYELAGLTLTGSSTVLAEADFPVRCLAFEDRREHAYYWFQHGSEVTDDYATKFWLQLFQYDEHWTQVSLLVPSDRLPATEMNQLKQLLTTLR